MAKLHEVLAVESDLEGRARRVTEEATATFKNKPNLFQGKTRSLELFNGDNEVTKAALENAEYHNTQVATTVKAKLGYVWDTIGPYFDAVLQKEATNQQAKADIVVNGQVVAKDVPVTFLLGLETKLKNLRAVYEEIPNRDPAINWEEDPASGEGIFKSPETVTLKTEKRVEYKIVAAATDKHPAQIRDVDSTVSVGQYKQIVRSGMITTAEKSKYLGAIDTLIKAVKQARQRANNTDLVSADISKNLRDFIEAAVQ